MKLLGAIKNVIWKKRILGFIGFLVVLSILIAALSILHKELSSYHFRDIRASFSAIPVSQIIIALLLTVLSYLVLTGYDCLALRYLKHPLPYGKTAFASFLGYVFSYNIGLSVLGGGTVRFRLYSAWKLSPVEITKLIGFAALTFWVGLFFLTGLAFVVHPLPVPPSIRVGVASISLGGFVLLAIVIVYLMLTITVRQFSLFGQSIELPTLKMGFAQIVLASVDLMIAASVLYELLPQSHPLPYAAFLGIYLMAMFLGLVSHVPGGLGVFETVILLFLGPYFPVPAIAGALLAYRLVYYLTPFCIALLLFIGFEVAQRRQTLWRTITLGTSWLPDVSPRIMALSTFLAGAILLVSGATPAESERMYWLRLYLPLPAIELSHFLGSITGVLLLVLARGIHRKLDAAYHLTRILLGAGIVFCLLKGFDYEEAIILSIMLVALTLGRRSFYRKAALLSIPLTLDWLVAVGLLLVGVVWIGLFAYHHVEYSHDLWWHFAFRADASRFLRASVGATVVILIYSLMRLLRVVETEITPDMTNETAPIESIAMSSPKTYSRLALLGDKTFLVDESKTAFFMFGVEGGTWVTLGDPVGPEERWHGLIWKFREACDRADCLPAFYQVGTDSLSLYLDAGMRLFKLGEEAMVSLPDFTLEGGARKSLRQGYHRTLKEGLQFEIVKPEEVPPLLSELKRISDQWLAAKNTREKGFSLGFFDESYLQRFPVALVRSQGQIIAFSNVWCGANKEELSVDLMRHSSDAPAGVMELMFVELLLWGKKEGYKTFSMGMAPLAGLENRRLAPLWQRIGAVAFQYGEYFYNFQGLRDFKEKFNPVWEPRYLASPGGVRLPIILTNIAGLISRGLKGVIAK